MILEILRALLRAYSKKHSTGFYKMGLVLLCIFFVPSILFSREGIDATIDIGEVEDGYVLNASNNEPFLIYVVIQFPKLEGLQPSIELPAIIKLETGDNKGVFNLKKDGDLTPISYQMSYKFLFTHPINIALDTPSPEILYVFPYKHGTQYSVAQAWKIQQLNRASTDIMPDMMSDTLSNTISDDYLVGFDMPEGTEVYAARDGIVVDIKSDSIIGGNSPIYEHKANFVLIKHADNTLSHYTHLLYQGVVVNVGQSINAGSLIAYSGGTGYVDGNQLDFSVQVSKINGEMVSIPFYFRGKNDVPTLPKKGQSYYAYVPGKEAFQEVHGEDIQKENYIHYRKKLRPNFPLDIIKIREKIVDDTVLLFIRNGFDRNVSADVHLILNNVLADESMPLSVHIPARSEMFLAILTIEHSEKAHSISSRMQYRFIE